MRVLRYLQDVLGELWLQAFGPEICPMCHKEVDGSHPLGMCPDYESIMFHRGHLQQDKSDIPQEHAGGNQ